MTNTEEKQSPGVNSDGTEIPVHTGVRDGEGVTNLLLSILSLLFPHVTIHFGRRFSDKTSLEVSRRCARGIRGTSVSESPRGRRRPPWPTPRRSEHYVAHKCHALHPLGPSTSCGRDRPCSQARYGRHLPSSSAAPPCKLIISSNLS